MRRSSRANTVCPPSSTSRERPSASELASACAWTAIAASSRRSHLSPPRADVGARFRWVATDADRLLATVLTRLGPEAENAAAEGRAFVNGVRARVGSALQTGDSVEVWDAREALHREARPEPLRILYD